MMNYLKIKDWEEYSRKFHEAVNHLVISKSKVSYYTLKGRLFNKNMVIKNETK